MQLSKSEQLYIDALSHLFDNMSESYKLFWLQAILDRVYREQQENCYDELVDDMVANLR